MTGPKKGSRGRAPKRNTAQGRGGITRDTVKPARERTTSRGSEVERTGSPDRGAKARGTGGVRGQATQGTGSAQDRRPAGNAGRPAAGKTGAGQAALNPARRKLGDTGRSERDERGAGERPFRPAARKTPPKLGRKPLPELKRVQLDAPPPDMLFVDRDGERLSFPDSNLKRVAAAVLSEKRKAWRYRPFSFPLFTDSGNEQAFHFDFYVYDAEDSVIRLLLVVPFESREVWDKVGRFKRQYPMYAYELWTPEKLAKLSGPRGRLDF